MKDIKFINVLTNDDSLGIIAVPSNTDMEILDRHVEEYIAKAYEEIEGETEEVILDSIVEHLNATGFNVSKVTVTDTLLVDLF